MSSDFWSRRLGGSAPPPHVQQPQPGPATGTAWWMTPAQQPAQPYIPPAGMPQGDSAVDSLAFTYQQLKAMRADQMSQGQMEALASIELQMDKYNQVCDQCGSNNYVPAGTRIGSFRMPTGKCFECGNSQGALTGSPEPALGGGGKPGRATLQVGGGKGSYGQHHSALPTTFLPRG